MKKIILLITVLLLSHTISAQTKGKVEVLWLGHAAFQITSPEGTVILIDPWISNNPNTPKKYKNIEQYKQDAIVVSHSHGDHFGDTLELAKSNNVKIISTRMTSVYPEDVLPSSLQTIWNIGGSTIVNDVKISCVPAMHSSDFGGRPTGIVLTFNNGETIYHTGDTWIFTDMQHIQEFFKPSIILLNVGGGKFAQDTNTAKASIKKYFNPKYIIPMHYGVNPFNLATEAEVKTVFKKDKRVLFMKPGETLEF